ncbi:MAG: glycosyltransferase family 39 protein, partial [Patescibacteria group bacterium]|nr:glycosyltransferase family 39 protein [Patescibacteria group bacterium]
MSNKKIIFLLILVGVIVVGFEIYNLTSMSLWHDEAFSGLLIQYDSGEMMHRIGLDVHPPFYYILLKAWTLVFSNCLFSLRLFSVFFATLAILIFYLLIKGVFRNKKFALFTSVLLA